ncbi:MAG TPA: hypothetical protein VEV16_07450 [Daejeonella sp.]|nr:hypothetical protein [Daejeonella sp.]
MKWKNRRSILFALTFLTCLFSNCNAQNAPKNTSLQLSETIILPDVSGRIDHMAFDQKNKVAFVAALGNNTIEVVDLTSGKVTHTIKNLKEPQGIIYIPESNTLVVTNGKNGECVFFDAATFHKISSIQLGDDADNIRYDATTRKIYVGYGNGGIAIIDASTFKLISQIKLSAHPEAFQINHSTNKMYVNVPDAHLIEVIDLNKNAVLAQWKITEAKANFSMALDESNQRLFIGCRHPSKLLVLDTETGKTISSIVIDGDADDIFFNNNTKEIYVTCGAGYVDVITQNGANNYKTNRKIKSKPGARTSLFIPELSLLIVAAPATINNNAQLMIYKSLELN